MKMILPIILFLTFFRLQSVLSTSHNSLIFRSVTGAGNDECWLPALHHKKTGAGNDEHGRYRNSLTKLLETFASQTTSPGYYNFTTSFPNTPNQLYGHYLCRGDVDRQACQSCVNFAKNDMLNKMSFNFNGREGLAWYDHCMIRFSNQSFFGKLDDRIVHGSFTSVLSDDDNENTVKGTGIPFMIILRDTLKQLAINASNDQNTNRFASRVVQFTTFQSYVAVQCTPDLVASACYRCLAKANKELLSMCGSVRGQVHYRSCMVEYKNTDAYTNNKAVKSSSSLSIPISPEDTNSTLNIRMRGTRHLESDDRSE